MTMPYRHETDMFFGGGRVPRQRVEAHLETLAPHVKALAARHHAASAPLIALAHPGDTLNDIAALGAAIQEEFPHVVVAGAGGSGLCGRMFSQLHPDGQVRFHFLENIDPHLLESALQLDAERCCYLVISKSGSTAETLSQFYVLWANAAAVLGEKEAARRFVMITMETPSPLRRAAQEHGMRILAHPADVGGRFSALSVVGLLPAAIAGLDIAALTRGAAGVVAQMDSAPHARACWPALGAALQVAAGENGYASSVMLPYADRLNGFSDWWRQGWAESLGKAGKGTTPIRAIGTTDQHSQLQLYLDGPKDKSFTLVFLDRAGTGPVIHPPEDAELDYLRGKTVGDVMEAEQQATCRTLVNAGCPVRRITLRRLDEESLGALLMHFTLEIAFASFLLGVNAYDQPAVEEGKELARQWLLGHEDA